MDAYGELTREQWEAICRRCAKCCYEKVDLGGGIIRYTDEPCEHLDTKTKLCKVYENRHEAEPDCISLTEHLVRFLHWDAGRMRLRGILSGIRILSPRFEQSKKRKENKPENQKEAIMPV